MSRPSATLNSWNKLTQWPAGRWLFSRIVCFKAPYFSSIRPQIAALRQGYCEVHLTKRRAVQNHIGTVHAIAMCNMAELAAGVMTDASLPSTHRWIPKGMTVEYLKKAQTHLVAKAALERWPDLAVALDVPVSVDVLNTAGELVFKATVTMRVSPK